MKVKTTLFVTMILALLLSGASGMDGVWMNIKKVTIQSKHLEFKKASGGLASVSNYSFGDNEVIHLKVQSYWFTSRQMAEATYDLGEETNNDGCLSEGKTYGVKLHIYISGNFDGNEDINTYFKITLKLYYVDGNSENILGTSTRIWTEDTTFNNYYDLFVVVMFLKANTFTQSFTTNYLEKRHGGQ